MEDNFYMEQIRALEERISLMRNCVNSIIAAREKCCNLELSLAVLYNPEVTEMTRTLNSCQGSVDINAMLQESESESGETVSEEANTSRVSISGPVQDIKVEDTASDNNEKICEPN